MNTFIGPCATEDATDCYWNAPTMGNGTGTSFVSIDGTATSIEGCAPGEGLPAVDFDADGTPWAYCERALGNDVAPVEGPTDTVYIPETGEIIQETTKEVLEVVPTPEVTYTTEVAAAPELAVTGADDVNPFVGILGLVLVVSGIILSRRNRKAV